MELIRQLEQNGWILRGAKGSHHILPILTSVSWQAEYFRRRALETIRESVAIMQK